MIHRQKKIDLSLPPVIRLPGSNCCNLAKYAEVILARKKLYGGKRVRIAIGSHLSSNYNEPDKKDIKLFVKATKKVNMRRITFRNMILTENYVKALKNCDSIQFYFDYSDVCEDQKVLKKFSKYISSRKNLELISFSGNAPVLNLRKFCSPLLAKYTGALRLTNAKALEFKSFSCFLSRSRICDLILWSITFTTIYEASKLFACLSTCSNLEQLVVRRCEFEVGFCVPVTDFHVYSDLIIDTEEIEEVRTLFNLPLPTNLTYIKIEVRLFDSDLKRVLALLLKTTFYTESVFTLPTSYLKIILTYLQHQHDTFVTSGTVQRALELVRLNINKV